MTTDPTKRITQLSPEQRELLRRRLAAAAQNTTARAPILERRATAAEGVEVPLSFAQERAWLRERLMPGDGARNITGALRLEGQLSIDALSATLDEILRRHEPLRANFSISAAAPVQTIAPPSHLPIEFVDLSNLDRAQRESESRRRYAEETRRGFDLARDPLLRATLIRIGREEHLLLLAMHHIASDGWSIGVLEEEMRSLYTSFLQSREPDLPELPIRYGDFAAWQRRRLETGELEQGLSYWRKQLENPPTVVGLRPDPRPRSVAAAAERKGGGAARCFLKVGAESKRRLEELSREEDTTLFTTLLASFMVLLMRCTGQRDIIVGAPVSGRTRVETERLIGLFVNTVALRARLSPKLTFRESLRVVRETVLDGLAHHEVPFERVVQELDAARRTARHPLFEILFNFTPSPPRAIDLPGLRARFEEPPETGAEFPAQLYITEWEGDLELSLVYQTALYSESRISCLLEQLISILRQVVVDADRPVSSLELTTALSRALLPNPAAALDAPAQQSVPHLIVEWAARTPDETAIRQADDSLTYADLRDGMAAVARRLRAEGFKRGDTVAVRGPRSPGIVVCMAGVLYGEGVLLTLATDLPEQRQRLMLEEADARFLLNVGELRDADEWLHNLRRPRVIGVDARGATAAVRQTPSDAAPEDDAPRPERHRPGGHFKAAEDASPGENSSSRPAYIFFTSGSTGKPKGVLGTHAGLAHFLDWQRKTFNVGPGDRCGQLTGLSFDVVLRDVFLPLTSGATLVLPAEDDVASGARTLRWLERERISLLHTVPSLVEMWLLNVPPDVALAELRRVFFAGEPLTSTLVGRWRDAFPQAGEIINLYGPTETTLAKCFYRVPSEPFEGIQPLGGALPDTQALLLTRERKMCGIGEPGEIALRTPFRSLGYVNAAGENDRRFIANPFGDASDDRLYLTGDRGVYGADGLLEFLGRTDDQIKVRGVRVEPSEVAAALKSCPEVGACAVLARADVAEEGPVLVAYVVPAQGAGQDAARLREFLSRRLPAAMIPSAFVFLDSLPLTPNQKLDRARLPAPVGLRPESEQGYVAPRDATELQMVQLWETLLKVSPIGIRDNFFALGGHSLLAMRLLMQVEQSLGRSLPLAAFFERATIEHLAEITRRPDQEWSCAVKLWSAEHRLKLFLVHPGGGTTHNYLPLVRHLAAPLPVYGLQARGLDGRSEPHRDIEVMAADYLEEIRRIQPGGPYLLGGHSLGGVIAFEMAKQLHESGQQVALLAMFDSALAAAPSAPAEGCERDEDAHRLADMVSAVEGFTGREIKVAYGELRALSTDEQLEYVVNALKRSGALPPGGGTEMIRNLLRVNKAHLRARRNYRPGLSPVPVTLFRARDARRDDFAPAEAVVGVEESLGWSVVSTEKSVRVLWTPGNHLTMMAEPNVEHLAEALRACLTEVVQSL